MEPWAELAVFRTSGTTDVGYVAGLLGLESTGDTVDWRAARGMIPAIGAQRYWVLSSAGQVPSRALRPHVDRLLQAIAGKEAEIARLRAEGYWVCATFHHLWQDAPDPAEVKAVDAELEARDITFDLELERDDFP